jgi:hypothetical protein
VYNDDASYSGHGQAFEHESQRVLSGAHEEARALACCPQLDFR